MKSRNDDGDDVKRNDTVRTWVIVFAIWAAARIVDIAIKHGRVPLGELVTALVTGVAVASAVAYAVHRRRAR